MKYEVQTTLKFEPSALFSTHRIGPETEALIPQVTNHGREQTQSQLGI